MVGHQQHRQPTEAMYGTATTVDRIATDDIESVEDRITREAILDCLLNTPQPLPPDALAARTNTTPEAVELHLDALVSAGIATATTDERYTTTWDSLPLEDAANAGDAAAVFRLESRDKEYREWFGVDDPYDATQPPNADIDLAVAALGQWFGVRKRLHRLADSHTQ